MSQEDFARAIRVSVRSIENEKYNPSPELAFTIADFFGLPIEEIFIHERSSVHEKSKSMVWYQHNCCRLSLFSLCPALRNTTVQLAVQYFRMSDRTKGLSNLEIRMDPAGKCEAYQAKLEQAQIDLQDKCKEMLRNKAGRYAWLLCMLVCLLGTIVLAVSGSLGLVEGYRLALLVLAGLAVFQYIAGIGFYRHLSRKY